MMECLLAFADGVCSTAHNSLISLCLANQINFEVSVIVSLWLVYCGGDEKCGHQPCDYGVVQVTCNRTSEAIAFNFIYFYFNQRTRMES